jgi:hypothetical protein
MKARQTIIHLLVGFEVLTAVVIKSTTFWDITPCSPLKANQCFGGTYRLHLQGTIRREIYQRGKAACHLLSYWYLARFIRPWRWTRYVPETSVDFQRITRLYILKDGTLQYAYLFTMDKTLHATKNSSQWTHGCKIQDTKFWMLLVLIETTYHYKL